MSEWFFYREAFMESFIYDYYGYNVDQIKEGKFEYQNYIFLLAATSENESSIENLVSFTEKIVELFSPKIVYFVKNKYDKYVSSQEDGNNICLLTYQKDQAVSINDFVRLHTTFLHYAEKKIHIEEIISLWEQRTEYIQNQCLVNLNFDNEAHVDLYEQTNYALGFALNALQYLSDLNIDYKMIYQTTLTHRRIKEISTFELCNPFNLIMDHSSRDLSELYKNNLIDLKTLFDICSYYQYREDEMQYLMARLLFPTSIFDLIEDIYNDSQYNYTQQIYQIIRKQKEQMIRIKEFYLQVKTIINIRPLRWLETLEI